MTIGEFIKKRRIELGITLEQIGDATGVAKSTVAKWENGYISNMKRNRICALAKMLNVSPAIFIDSDNIDYKEAINSNFDISSVSNITALNKTKKVPQLGTIACGEPLLAEQNIEDYNLIGANIDCDFSLVCKGDSMINARIFDGDIVYIKKQSDVDDGEIAAVLIDDSATLKKVHKYPNKLVLSPCNPMYDDLVYIDEQLNNIRILGKAVAFTSIIRY